MKALDYLHRMKQLNEEMGCEAININEAIKEIEELQSNIDTSIEEIEYALAKPDYANVYLNNALRFLKGES